MARKINTGYIIWGTAVAVLATVIVFPTLLIFYNSFVVKGEFTLRLVKRAFLDEENVRPVLNTLQIGFLVTLCSTVIGSFFAWLFTRTDIPLRDSLRAFFIIPFMMPPFIGAIAWGLLLSPRSGYFNLLFKSVFNTEHALFNIFSFQGIVFLETLYMYPFVFLTVAGALERMDPTMEEAARVSGAGTFRVMRGITLPTISPNIAAGALLVFVASISNFGIPALIGSEPRIFVLTTVIFRRFLESSVSFEGLKEGASLSIVLILLSTLALALQSLVLRGKRYTVIAGKSMRPQLVRLRRWRAPLFVLSSLFLLVVIIAPLVAIYLVSFLKSYGMSLAFKNLTLDNYITVLFKEKESIEAIKNSLFLSFTASLLTVAIGGVIAYILVKTKMRGRRLLEFFAVLPYSIPGTVVAIAMLLAWSGTYYVNMYNTIWIIFVAYLARFMPFAVKSLSASLEQVHDSLEEAARISGATWTTTCRDVIIPLLRPGFIAALLLILMEVMRELTVSILLFGPHTRTIGVAIYMMQEDGYYVWSAALSGLVIFLILGGNFLCRKITGGKIGF
ncbi:MAG: ABC transporter permease [Candidatus Binatia bacterium]